MKRDRKIAGKQRVRARKASARAQREAIEAYVARTGAPLVDEDKYIARIKADDDFRLQNNARLALANGARPWR
jgi:hypothetical protein